MMSDYDHKAIEKKWQDKWHKDLLYSPDIFDAKLVKSKFYNLWMFPYPSAEGLHAGHAFASTGSDVIGRFNRMNGKTVFQPIGYDSFGIHAENFAIKINEAPKAVIDRTTKNYERQMRSLGHGYDWTRTVTTSNPDYYKWTQWLFIKLYKAGLAYKKKAWVNFCPGCKTVLADEQVVTPAQAGKLPPGYNLVDEIPEGIKVCERCGNIPERRELSQWFLKITKYADRLLKNLDKIDWSERVKVAQREWIGKKEGIEITYPIKDTKTSVTCFTTRPDTNFGATFIVVSPEYARDNLTDLLEGERKQKVSEYIERSLAKTEQQRKEEGTIKTGEFTDLYAVNRLNNDKMPIWVSDFVLAGFGTGAVVGVPAHDKRDFEFAKTFQLPIKKVIESKEEVFEGEGQVINSDFLDGMESAQAMKKIMDYLEEKGWGKRETTYHLRDWLISRQRYWGAPIPMIYCPACAEASSGKGNAGWFPVPEKQLPVLLPEIDDYKPKGDGGGPLASHPEFYEVTCPECGGPARRETDVSDTFLDSSWYFLRYPSVGIDDAPWDQEITKNWLPVDLYFGGAEHSVLHLMYARFVTIALFDLGLLKFEEPFSKFYAHGLMIKDGAKMSKSRGNVVNPDAYVEKYGADTLRLYSMFLGQMDGYPDFRDTGIEGMAKFVRRLWKLFSGCDDSKLPHAVKTKLHLTIKKVTEDINVYHYNTAISSLMELMNALNEANTASREAVEPFVQLVAPFTPHLAEEAWVEVLGNKGSVHNSSWPLYDKNLIEFDDVKLVIQVDGKLRGTIGINKDDSKDEARVKEMALAQENIQKWTDGKNTHTIFVPGKLINFVTR